MDLSKTPYPIQPATGLHTEPVEFVPPQTAYPVQPNTPSFQPSYEAAPPPYPTTAGYPNQTAVVGYLPQPGYSEELRYPQEPGIPQQQGYTEHGYPNQNYSNELKDDPPAYASPSDSSQNILGDSNWVGFSEKAIRNAFIRKVYAILMLQLAFTVGIVSLFVFEKRVKKFVQSSPGMYGAAYVLFLSVYIALVCCRSLRRKHPTNIVLLCIFTVALTYLVATLSSFHDTYVVVMALGICTACCLAISVFSCFTKFDFTSCAGVLFVLSWVLFLFGIIAIFTYRTYPIVNTIYAGLGALVFMLFLAFDTQMVMGGKKYQLSPEEYIFAALQLYLDIVYIFLFILSLLGGGKK